mgnify:CR=1 FL=1
MKKKYIIKKLKKAERKSEQLFLYLREFETETFDEKLQININRICVIDEIVSSLIIELECTKGEITDERR